MDIVRDSTRSVGNDHGKEEGWVWGGTSLSTTDPPRGVPHDQGGTPEGGSPMIPRTKTDEERTGTKGHLPGLCGSVLDDHREKLSINGG